MAEREDFEEYVAARYGALVRSAYLLVGNRADAEDLVQTALSRLVSAWPRISGDPERYVRTVLVRESVTRWRRRRWREVSTERLPEAAAPGQLDQAAADRVALHSALGQLSPRQRAVVFLRFYEDLTVAETAEVLRCSEGTVKSQTHDALARLRGLLPDLTPQ
ncbi:MAG: SigE family RNA polymerase sigma factor [Nocardioides sp.]|uniref:SigE family RNA polymerase sigma factor n=1 Tax=Nocardioides sp. TaxID=35761 RepID=UPI0039E350B6